MRTSEELTVTDCEDENASDGESFAHAVVGVFKDVLHDSGVNFNKNHACNTGQEHPAMVSVELCLGLQTELNLTCDDPIYQEET